LKITGGEVSGNVTGTGKLLLSSDRKFIKELTIKGKLFDGREIAVTFVADAPESLEGIEPGFISVGCVAPMQPCTQGSVMRATFSKLRF
jgi:hypothetical protein